MKTLALAPLFALSLCLGSLTSCGDADAASACETEGCETEGCEGCEAAPAADEGDGADDSAGTDDE